MIHQIKLEICAGSLSDVMAVNDIPEVDRIELNSSLESGGLTPSLHTFLLAKQYSNKKIICMVRPRQAGFVYNTWEKETMLKDAETFLQNGADGIVFGCLNKDRTIDEAYTKRMTTLIHQYKKEAVFHKAFDETPDPIQAVQTLTALGIDRILTSGQQPSTYDGIPLISTLQKEYGSKIEILPGGGVNKDNIHQILQQTGCTQIHMTAKSTLTDTTDYYAVDRNKVLDIIHLLKKPVHGHKVFTREDQEMFDHDAYEQDMFNDDTPYDYE